MVRYEEEQGGCGWIGLVELLGIIMLFMRWFGLIDWSWWIVLAPFYIPAGILIGLFVFGLIRVDIEKRNKEDR